jgi:hypothetical protein
MVLLSLRAGQVIPEHTTKEMLNVYAISGHITFFADHRACDLWAGEVLWLESCVPDRLEAHEGSALLVLAADDTGSPGDERKEEGPEIFRIRVRREACPTARESSASDRPGTLLQGNCRG